MLRKGSLVLAETVGEDTLDCREMPAMASRRVTRAKALRFGAIHPGPTRVTGLLRSDTGRGFERDIAACVLLQRAAALTRVVLFQREDTALIE